MMHQLTLLWWKRASCTCTCMYYSLGIRYCIGLELAKSMSCLAGTAKFSSLPLCTCTCIYIQLYVLYGVFFPAYVHVRPYISCCSWKFVPLLCERYVWRYVLINIEGLFFFVEFYRHNYVHVYIYTDVYSADCCVIVCTYMYTCTCTTPMYNLCTYVQTSCIYMYMYVHFRSTCTVHPEDIKDYVHVRILDIYSLGRKGCRLSLYYNSAALPITHLLRTYMCKDSLSSQSSIVVLL